MKLIIGLGNPAKEYSLTRHNAGRFMAEAVAQREGCPFQPKKPLKISAAEIHWGAQDVIVAYPEVFMNVSGEAVWHALKHYNLDAAKDLLILVDDLDLPFGRLRLRAQGSSGGHRGLESIEYYLGSSAFARLRIGIGRPVRVPEPVPARDYVLMPFSPDEKKALDGLCERGYEACRLWTGTSIEKAMSVVNARLAKG